MRKLQIAVIGSAGQLSSQAQQLAYQVGKTIVNNNCRLITGGMGGIMEAASKGAADSEAYESGDIIAVLPSYTFKEANQYVDIILPTGLGVARNTVLMASCDAVIALDGGAGTLSEISFAWQMKKPIAYMGDNGWHKRLSSLAIDHRRTDQAHVFTCLDELSTFIKNMTRKNSFQGILKKPDITKEMALHIQDKYDLTDLAEVGRGSEGIVWKANNLFIKSFYPNDYMVMLYMSLSKISQSLESMEQISAIPKFSCDFDSHLTISYPAFESEPYLGGMEESMITFLREMKQLNLSLSNVKADNFRIINDSKLVFIDIGRDIHSFSTQLFDSMCRRAFLTVNFSKHPDFSKFCQYTNNHKDFKIIPNHQEVLLEEKYCHFIEKVNYA